jgi:hypothetical protein
MEEGFSGVIFSMGELLPAADPALPEPSVGPAAMNILLRKTGFST